MQFKQFLPSYSLSKYIEMYWYLEGKSSELEINRQFITPDTRTNLILNFGSSLNYSYGKVEELITSKSVFVGQRTNPYFGAFGEDIHLISIRFSPSGAFQFFGVPAIETNEKFIDLYDIVGSTSNLLIEQIYETKQVESKIELIENWLMKLLLRKTKTNDYLEYLINKITANKGMLSLNQISNYSESEYKKLQRLFNNNIGLSPKLFSRMLRFDNICNDIIKNTNNDWMMFVADYELTDQSHLIKEFQSFTGFSPSEFVKNLNNKTMTWV